MPPCHCRSHQLYKTDYTSPTSTFIVDGIQYKTQRQILTSPEPHKLQHLQQNPIYQSLLQTSELWLPSGTEIDKVSWDQIQFNPIWFYKNYIAKNVPCVIEDMYEGDQICQRWADQKYIEDVMQDYNGISMSLTPDGFADSIKGPFFIEPQQVKTNIKSFLNHQQTLPNTVPYIQHQNSSLTQEMWMLHAQIDQDPLKFMSKHFFNEAGPDAQNFWMGYDQSVSSMHKDPYENFYTTITGEKHFTLLPPSDVLYLEEQQFKKAKWSYHADTSSFTCQEALNEKTNWIACNVDLQHDLHNTQAFPSLSKIHKFHVTLQKGQTLYLPSLWYHQVAQTCGKDPYVMAINYWFDMGFGQNYSLYEVCRKLKGL